LSYLEFYYVLYSHECNMGDVTLDWANFLPKNFLEDLISDAYNTQSAIFNAMLSKVDSMRMAVNSNAENFVIMQTTLI